MLEIAAAVLAPRHLAKQREHQRLAAVAVNRERSQIARGQSQQRSAAGGLLVITRIDIAQFDLAAPIIQEFAVKKKKGIFHDGIAAEIPAAGHGGKNLGAAENLAGLEPVVAGHQVGVDIVAAPLVAKVVDLETRGDGAQGRIEDHVAFLLVQGQAAGPAAQRRGIGIQRQVVGVGTLKIVQRRLLQPEDHIAAAADPGRAQPSGQRPVSAFSPAAASRRPPGPVPAGSGFPAVPGCPGRERLPWR